MEGRVLLAASLVVINTQDSGLGSLRQALIDANAAQGLDTITFDIPGSGPHTITLATSLPAVTDPVVIDATTQPGYAGTPLIVLAGNNPTAPVQDGLGLGAGSDGSTIRGLALTNFTHDGIQINGSSHDTIAGNYLGVDNTGTSTTTGNGTGLEIRNSSANTIGGVTTADRNLISGNGTGLFLLGSAGAAAADNVIEGNDIGTDASGANALKNQSAGISLSGLVQTSRIGGTTAAERNVISGNGNEGIFFGGVGNASVGGSNVVEGNYIGTDATGMTKLGNGLSGITLSNSFGNTIGGIGQGAGNLISGNGPANGVQPGISIAGGSQDNVVEGNLIGPNATGSAPLTGGIATSNSAGIVITDSPGNTIGGTDPGARNTIAFNAGLGVYVFNLASSAQAIHNHIINNLVNANGNAGIQVQSPTVLSLGTEISGNTVTGNMGNGVYLLGTSDNSVVGNTISGNTGDGVTVDRGTGNSILSDMIFADGSHREIHLTSHGNNDQPAPVLTTAVTPAAGGTTITGTLDAAPLTSYRIQFFSSPAADSPGFGEGQTFLGELPGLGSQPGVVTTDSNGHASFTATVPQAVAADQFLTATATSTTTGDTSAFSLAQADLAVSIVPSPSGPVTQGDDVTYTITLKNNGASPAVGVILTDTLSPLETFVSSIPATTPSGNAVTFTLDTLARGASITFHVVTHTVGSGQLTNSVSATTTGNAGNPDVNPSDNTAQATLTVIQPADLAVTATAAPDPVNQGETLTYTLTVANQGPATAILVTLVNTLPAGVSYLSDDSGGVLGTDGVTLTFSNIGYLSPHTSDVIHISVRATTPGPATDTAHVSSATPDNNSENDTATITTIVEPSADLELTGSVQTVPGAQGSDLLYTLTVMNHGPSGASGLTIVDTLPAGVTLVSTGGGAGNPKIVGNVVTFAPRGTLATGSSQVAQIQVHPLDAGTFVNNATTSFDGSDPDSDNNAVTLSTDVRSSFTVTNVNNSGPGSLRQALLSVNADKSSTSADTILFRLPNDGNQVIRLSSLLPTITHAATIDATPGSPSNPDGTVPIIIDGSGISVSSTSFTQVANLQSIGLVPLGLLDVDASGVQVRGLSLRGYDAFSGFGIVLDTHAAGDTVAGNTIGTNPAGTAVANTNAGAGILVLSANHTIGGTTAADGNVISGNKLGLYLLGAAATGNTVIGNHIGTDRAGGTILGAAAGKLDGIDLDGAVGNKIGLPTGSNGAGTAPGNLIEGYQAGIYLFSGAANNAIQGNAVRGDGISTSDNSNQELGGILISGSNNNQIGLQDGKASPGSGNDISGNRDSGIVLFDATTGTLIGSNSITNNSNTGVYIQSAPGNHVGLNGTGNTITDNAASGVDIEGTASTTNVVLDNMILRNGKDGVYLFSAPGNMIGGTNPGDGNTIQQNGFSGVHLETSGANQNVVQGNTITDQKNGYGVLLENGATQNTIGGAGGAANTFQNNAKGNVGVFNNGSPPAGDPTGGNTIGNNKELAAGQALTTSSVKRRRHKHGHPPVGIYSHAGGRPHPKGPHHHFRTARHFNA
jgi:uncharacterized repeat protein (TIGR01451 family)